MSKVLWGVNSRCGVQSKRKCENHESCVCIVGFSACGCQKKSVVYETVCRQLAAVCAARCHMALYICIAFFVVVFCFVFLSILFFNSFLLSGIVDQ